MRLRWLLFAATPRLRHAAASRRFARFAATSIADAAMMRCRCQMVGAFDLRLLPLMLDARATPDCLRYVFVSLLPRYAVLMPAFAVEARRGGTLIRHY